MSEKEVITLSEEETKEIEKVLKERQKGAKQPKEDPKVVKAKKEARESFLHIKKVLKSYTKNQLIELVWTYGVEIHNMQNAAQVLFEENEELKKQLGVEDVEVSDESN